MKTKKIVLIAGFASLAFAGSLAGQCYKDLPKEELSPSEISSLQWMRQEEMLAHDVYASLATQYDMPVFRNIEKSEMRHTEAVGGLLERYELEDPAADHRSGVFQSQEIQSLYDKLVKQGSQSYEEAVRVGLQIEELDIADLEKALAEEVDNEDITMVYNNLLRGSKHHLNAFWSHASRNSIQYEPEHIPMDEFMEILGTDQP